jgi:hypothetical protein
MFQVIHSFVLKSQPSMNSFLCATYIAHKLCPSTAFFSLVRHIVPGSLVGQPSSPKKYLNPTLDDNIPSLLPRKSIQQKKMATNPQEDHKPDGAAFDDFFESLGKKAEHLTVDERNGQKEPATNGTGSLDTAAKGEEEDENEPKIVDEIESLCMNCHENVWSPKSPVIFLLTADARESLVSSSHVYPSSAK